MTRIASHDDGFMACVISAVIFLRWDEGFTLHVVAIAPINDSTHSFWTNSTLIINSQSLRKLFSSLVTILRGTFGVGYSRKGTMLKKRGSGLR